jgi:hypothetical protein
MRFWKIIHHFGSLPRDPFADIRRAVSESSSVEFSLSEEFHNLAVDQIDVLEIDGNGASFGFDCVAKCVQIQSCDSAAYGQDHDAVATDDSVDPAAHFEIADEVFALLLICAFPAHAFRRRTSALSNPSALLKLLKLFDQSGSVVCGST